VSLEIQIEIGLASCPWSVKIVLKLQLYEINHDNPSSSLQQAFAQGRALKVISGLNNFNAERVAATVTAAQQGGATFVDIAVDADLVR